MISTDLFQTENIRRRIEWSLFSDTLFDSKRNMTRVSVKSVIFK